MMGWDFGRNDTPHSIAAAATAGWEGVDCIAACLTSEDGIKVLWVVLECTKPHGHLDGASYRPAGHRWIMCVLIRAGHGGWGSKHMDEAVGPFYYSCPLEFLEMVPVPAGNDWAANWRDKVYRANDGEA